MTSGLNFTVAYSESDPDVGNATRDATFFKAGYKQGMHAIAIDVAESNNDLTNIEGESTGLTYVYFPHPGVKVFVMAR